MDARDIDSPWGDDIVSGIMQLGPYTLVYPMYCRFITHPDKPMQIHWDKNPDIIVSCPSGAPVSVGLDQLREELLERYTSLKSSESLTVSQQTEKQQFEYHILGRERVESFIRDIGVHHVSFGPFVGDTGYASVAIHLNNGCIAKITPSPDVERLHISILRGPEVL